MGSGGRAPHIHSLGNRKRCMITFTPGQHPPPACNILLYPTTVLCHFPPLLSYTCSVGSVVYVKKTNEPTATGTDSSQIQYLCCFNIPSTQELFIRSWYVIRKRKLLYKQGFHASKFAWNSPDFISFQDLSQCPAKFRAGSQILQVFPSHKNATFLTICTNI